MTKHLTGYAQCFYLLLLLELAVALCSNRPRIPLGSSRFLFRITVILNTAVEGRSFLVAIRYPPIGGQQTAQTGMSRCREGPRQTCQGGSTD